MNIDDKLELYQELINCNYNVYTWKYGKDLSLQHTNCPPELISSDIVSFLSSTNVIIEHTKNSRAPLIVDTTLGLIWITAFEFEDDNLKYYHMVGPAFNGKNSHAILKKELDKRNLSVKLRAKIFKQIENIPIIPTTMLFQYAIMLHYCITGHKITASDIQFPHKSHDSSDNIKMISEEHRGIWKAEQQLLSMIRDGNPDYITALDKSTTLSNGIKFDIGDSMRQQKNSVHTLLTLCSRTSIEGGLSPSIAYTLCDYYTQRIEESTMTSELSIICRNMLDDYVNRINQAKQKSSISKQIKSCCDYIQTHITEDLSIGFLAGRLGYTEYYFSHKFKQEVGCSVSTFIMQQKIEEAKLLLSTTNLSIQDISDELDFGSRSYFSSTFQKHVTMSPSEYREEHFKV